MGLWRRMWPSTVHLSRSSRIARAAALLYVRFQGPITSRHSLQFSKKEYWCSSYLKEQANFSQPQNHVECRHPLLDVERLEKPAETDQLCGKSIKTLTKVLLAEVRINYDRLRQECQYSKALKRSFQSNINPLSVFAVSA